MKLRLDLLAHLTAADILEEAAANQHRYKAEPSFSKTGIGHLSPRSTADSANEAGNSEALTRETHAAVAAEWAKHRASELDLLDTFGFSVHATGARHSCFSTVTPLPRSGAPWPVRYFQTCHFIAAKKLHPPPLTLLPACWTKE
ncbi:MAG: hypothetical protein ACRED1_11770 [Limisphaerales bacterium]